jgi:predicted glycoside hydrolase/deacetylase ChbG (UPF0249 family)
MQRMLLVTADDFGIGPETSRGILDLAELGVVLSTVLLVNSPFAADAVRQWRRRGNPLEIGWHPCLTLDAPVLPPHQVPTLVTPAGRFHTLGAFLRRLALGRISEADIESELSAQYERFLDLMERLPVNVNAHHHIHVFAPVRRALSRVLDGQSLVPYVRRVIESTATLVRVPGARFKRWFLTRCGSRYLLDYPGNDELLGVTAPECVHEPDFFDRWFAASRGRTVELTCHPGRLDRTIIGRDGTLTDGQVQRRPAEYERLSAPRFLDGLRKAGFVPIAAETIARTALQPNSSFAIAG